jgi:hypothetical protein
MTVYGLELQTLVFRTMPFDLCCDWFQPTCDKKQQTTRYTLRVQLKTQEMPTSSDSNKSVQTQTRLESAYASTQTDCAR